MVLLPFHAPVLEPDFNLSFRETQRVRNLDAPSASQVSVEVKLFLQFEHLVSRVGSPRAFVVSIERAGAP